ncbi:MAG: hypothetical protein P0Y49_14850 [Candidatus Pedobacter colombiensis]|uniref:Uncharacterized protein n=1 Tax=Candidatus Pedobacter colombiensis TaxID=3121371 RepID=A0AAJ5W7Q6_9SPHI|nr:hypothetical protein [Pedobacter sp.]WEK18072.1 MAG: hypothetical protein P0Y49_14850 [Pedobacter sp.]
MMKNYIYIILAFVAMAFAACNPMKDTIDEITANAGATKTLNITTTATYETVAAANTGIAVMLNKTYPQMTNGALANVTYSYKTNTVKPVDSVYANVTYTVTDADYLATNGNANKNFTSAKVLEFLESKYPQASTPLNKLVILTYTFFLSNVTTGTLVTEAYLLQSIGWQKIYLVSNAQYTSVGRGTNNMFLSGDAANLAGYFNIFLKADPTVMLTAKVGDKINISYRVFQSTTVSYQRVYVLTYDGVNWLPNTTLGFLKQNGQWIPDPTIYYTMITTDYTNLNLPGVTYTFGTAANRGNAAQYRSINVSATNGTQWTTAEIQAMLIYTLNLRFPNAVANPEIPYVITYYSYNGKYTYVPVKFFKTDTGFVLANP